MALSGDPYIADGVDAYVRAAFTTLTNVVIASANVAFSARFLGESLRRATATK